MSKMERFVRKDLTCEVLKIFLQRFYSLEWIRDFLLEKRFQSLMKGDTIHKSYENDILLCINTALEMYPTARGLQALDWLVNGNENTIPSLHNFSFNAVKVGLKSVRYRVSLLHMANEARQHTLNELASLWVIAATADLNHISGYQSYLAAKQEEARCLGYSSQFAFWQEERDNTRDWRNYCFDSNILKMQLFRENQRNDREFRKHLQIHADSRYHADIDNSNLEDRTFLKIWCHIKANRAKHTQEHLRRVENLCHGSNASIRSYSHVIIWCSEYEKHIEELFFLARCYRIKQSEEPIHADFWKKAVNLFEQGADELKKVLAKAATMNPGTDVTWIAINKHATRISECQKTFQSMIKTLTWPINRLSEIIQVISRISLLDGNVRDYLKPTLKKCESLHNIVDECFQLANGYVRARYKSVQEAMTIKRSLKSQEALFVKKVQYLVYYLPFLGKIEIVISLQGSMPEECYDRIIQSFPEECMSLNSNNLMYERIDFNKRLIESYDEAISFASAMFNEDQENMEQNSILFDLYLKKVNSMRSEDAQKCLDEAIAAVKRGNVNRKEVNGLIQASDDYISALQLVELSRKIRARNMSMKVKDEEEEVMIRRHKEGMQEEDHSENVGRLCSLYEEAASWMRDIATARTSLVSESQINKFRCIMEKFRSAADACELGQLELSTIYEQEAKMLILLLEHEDGDDDDEEDSGDHYHERLQQLLEMAKSPQQLMKSPFILSYWQTTIDKISTLNDRLLSTKKSSLTRQQRVLSSIRKAIAKISRCHMKAMEVALNEDDRSRKAWERAAQTYELVLAGKVITFDLPDRLYSKALNMTGDEDVGELDRLGDLLDDYCVQIYSYKGERFRKELFASLEKALEYYEQAMKYSNTEKGVQLMEVVSLAMKGMDSWMEYVALKLAHHCQIKHSSSSSAISTATRFMNQAKELIRATSKGTKRK